MATEEVIVEINADDNASGKMDDAAGAAESMGGRMSGAMKGAEESSKKFALALAGIGAAAVAMAFVAFKAYGEAELAQKQLEHAVVGVTKGTQEQLKATEALADALEKKGVLDGDNIKVGLAQLSTFGLQNETVRALGGSLADLAVNQFGVNASGEQLSQTANMIAKALNGQFGVLEKSGIRFTELQKKIIETGTEMEKAAAINEGFAQNLKLTNEVAMQTGDGLQAHLWVQLGNIQEAFGKLVSDAILPVIAAFSAWLDSFGGAEVIMQTLIDKFKVLQPYWPLIVGAIIGGLVPAFGALAVAVWGAIAPLLPFMAAGAAIAGLAYLIYEAYQTNFMGFGTLVNSVIESMMPVIQMFIDMWNSFAEAFTFAIEAISFIWENNIYGMRDLAFAVWDAISLYVMGFFNVIKGAFKIFSGLITGDWKMLWEGVKMIFTGISQMLLAQFQLWWEGLKLIFKIGGDLLSMAWTGFMDGIKAVASSIWEGIKGVFAAGINYLIDKLNFFIRGISAVSGAIGKVIGQKNWSIPEIPHLADGGIVTRPTLALIGEAGPEAVVPLGKGKGAGMGMGLTIVIEGNNFYGDDKTFAEKIGNQIVETLGMHLVFPRY